MAYLMSITKREFIEEYQKVINLLAKVNNWATITDFSKHGWEFGISKLYDEVSDYETFVHDHDLAWYNYMTISNRLEMILYGHPPISDNIKLNHIYYIRFYAELSIRRMKCDLEWWKNR